MQPSGESASTPDSLARSIPHPPGIILFDWHATLVDTMDAMYQATNDMLGMLALLQPPLRGRVAVRAGRARGAVPDPREIMIYGAARTLIRVAIAHPEVLRDLAA